MKPHQRVILVVLLLLLGPAVVGVVSRAGRLRQGVRGTDRSANH
jgi:hypothetical protein